MQEKMKNKKKTIVRVVTAAIFLLFTAHCAWHIATTEREIKVFACGVVVSKSNDEVSIKYGVKTELYLNINFNNLGFLSKKVPPTTYFKYNKGDRICLSWSYANPNYNYLYLTFLAVVASCILAVLLMTLIYYILPE